MGITSQKIFVNFRRLVIQCASLLDMVSHIHAVSVMTIIIHHKNRVNPCQLSGLPVTELQSATANFPQEQANGLIDSRRCCRAV